MAPVPALRPNFLDRAIGAVAPIYAARRMQARVAVEMVGQYAGARSKKAALKAWRTFAGSADTDTLGDLFTLRARSRDLSRNNPVAVGAKNTARTHTVGTGLKLRSQIDRELLGLSEDEAEVWERTSEKLFHLWAKSTSCDVSLTQNFYQLQGLVFNTVFESGDCLVLRRRAKLASVSPLALAIVEADRLATPAFFTADPMVRSGVRLDDDGAPQTYFILDFHPGDYILQTPLDYTEVPAFGAKSGERMVLHVYNKLRPGLTRGVPELAPVIEILKQLDRYTEAELMAAVVASFFTVFLKTAGGDGFAKSDDILPPGFQLEKAENEVVLGPGSIVNLADGEEVQTANPGRSNSNFDAFFSAIIRQIGVALGIPYELLIMHFTASYTASRAAIEMATKFFAERREWLISAFCAPVYEWFLSDSINAGRIVAPGFFEDPVLRAAWSGAMWITPAGLVLDPQKEWAADELGIEVGAQTLEDVTLKRNGGDWRQKTEQRTREHALRAAAKLEPEILGQTNSAVQDKLGDDGGAAHGKGAAPAAKKPGKEEKKDDRRPKLLSPQPNGAD